MKLHICKEISFPIDVVTQAIALIGRRGSGKSYCATKFVEQLWEKDAQVIVLDPVGTWWGLRLAADSKSPGIPITVLGGDHGDLPIESTAGKLIADTVVDKGISAVIDVMKFRKNERKQFMTDFAEQLFHRKKSSRSPMMLVIEESQVFIPQKTFKGEERMLGAMEDIVKLGRNYGIGVILISQRPQSVNKDVLNQTEILTVFQTTGPQERKVVEGWIAEHAETVTEAVDKLPHLEQGTAYLWSPQFLKFFGKIHVLPKWTFDASATPKFGQAMKKQPQLAPVDLEEIRQAIKSTVEKAEENDPNKLKRQIFELKKQLAQSQQAQPESRRTEKVKKIEVPVINDRQIQRLETQAKKLFVIANQIADSSKSISAAAEKKFSVPNPAIQAQNKAPRILVGRITRTREREPMVIENPKSSVGLGAGEKRILKAIAQHDEGVERDQLTVLTGYKRSTRDAYIQRLKERELLDLSDGRIIATAAGMEILGSAFEPLPTGEALIDYYRMRLPRGEWLILETLLNESAKIVSRDELTEATGFKRSTRDAYLQRLRARRLIETHADGISVSEKLLT